MNDLNPTKTTTTSQTADLPPATTREKLTLLLVAVVTLALDQATKFIVEANMPLYTMYEPLPRLAELFRFTHVPNTGTAFGLFPDGSLFFGVMAVVVGGFILYYNQVLPGDNRLLRLALGFQLGGAIGNLIDRIRLGHVTDFLDFGPWPIFNLADTAIVAGVVVLGWMMLQEWLDEREQASSTLNHSGDYES